MSMPRTLAVYPDVSDRDRTVRHREVDVVAKLFAADLRGALDFKLSEVLRFDLLLGVIGGTAAGFLAWKQPAVVIAVSPWMAASVGVVIGAVVAGLSVLVAFLDQPFLRKLRAINQSPVRYLAPFLFTAVLGIFSVALLTAVACFTPTAPAAPFIAVVGIAAFAGFWTLFSLIPGLDTLVQFVELKLEALDVPDDIVQLGSTTRVTPVAGRQIHS